MTTNSEKNRVKAFALLILLILLLAALSSCKKYEDGPGITVRTAQHRVVNNWHVTNFVINNESQMYASSPEDIMTNCGYPVSCAFTINTPLFKWNFTDSKFSAVQDIHMKLPDYTATYNNCVAGYIESDTTLSYVGSWSFTEKKQMLQMNFDDGTVWHFTITELRERIMKLSGYVGTDLYEITFEE